MEGLTPVHSTQTYDTEQFTQLTPAQRRKPSEDETYELDSSQTCVKQVYVSMHERIPVTPDNAEDLFNEICRSDSPPENTNWPLLDKVHDLYRKSTKMDFISEIIIEADSREDRLEEIRGTLFKSCQDVSAYPFPKDAELKRRKKTTSGKSVSHKLAYDIYTLASAIENNSYDSLKDLLNLPRTFSKSDLNASMSDSQVNMCVQQVNLLQSQLAKCQSDIVALKQDRVDSKTALDSELMAIRSEINKVKRETTDEMRKLRIDIQRIEDEKSSGLTSVKTHIKLVSEDIRQNKDKCDTEISDILERITQVSKINDRQFGRIESKLVELCKNYKTLGNKVNSVDIVSQSHPVGPDQSGECSSNVSSYSGTVTSVPFTAACPQRQSDHVIITTRPDESIAGPSVPLSEQGLAAPLDRDESQSRDKVDNVYTVGSHSGVARVPDQRSESIPVQKKIPVRITNNTTSQSGKQERDNRDNMRVKRDANTNKQAVGLSNVQNGEKNNDGVVVVDDDDDDDFIECVRKKTKRFYLGGFKSSINIVKLKNYVKNRGLKATMVRVFPQRNSRFVVVRLNVEAPNSSKMTEPGFWPKGVICRPWLSKNSYLKTLQNKGRDRDNYDNDNDDDDDLSKDVANNNNNSRSYGGRHYPRKDNQHDRRGRDDHRYGYGSYRNYNGDHNNLPTAQGKTTDYFQGQSHENQGHWRQGQVDGIGH